LNDAPDSPQNQFGLALCLWARQPSRGPDHDQAIALLTKIAGQTEEPRLATAARFTLGRAYWLGGQETKAAEIFTDMAANFDSLWHEEAAVALVQMAVASGEAKTMRDLVGRAEDWGGL